MSLPSSLNIFISENVALNKTTNQSSICVGYEGVAHLAVDGNTTTTFGDKNYPHPCTCSKGTSSTYWNVDLGRDYSLHDITIYQRSDSKFVCFLILRTKVWEK